MLTTLILFFMSLFLSALIWAALNYIGKINQNRPVVMPKLSWTLSPERFYKDPKASLFAAAFAAVVVIAVEMKSQPLTDIKTLDLLMVALFIGAAAAAYKLLVEKGEEDAF